VSTLRRWGTWWGRKWMGFIFTCILCFMAGIFAPAKCDTITFALVSAYGLYVGGHAATDVMNKRAPKGPAPQPSPTPQKVVVAKKDDEDANDVD
jgi:hypothetical protein